MTVSILQGDCRNVLATLPAASVHCCVTSPPYFGLRDYGVAGQIGLEPTPDAFVAEMVAVFREVRRVLRDDGTLWLNLGDSYAGGGGFSAGAPSTATSKSGKYGALGGLKAGGIKAGNGIKAKDLIGIPWRVAFALQADGWWLRSDIIWHKPNPMPESVTDRPTSAHEHIFLFAKSQQYYFDAEAVKERAARPDWAYESPTSPGNADRKEDGGCTQRKTDKQRGHSRRHAGFNDRWDAMSHKEQMSLGRNIRNVWTVATRPFSEAHFATFPHDLIEPCIKAGCPAGGMVLDPFGGAGTTGLVADRLGRDCTLIELNPEYADMARRRILGDAPLFADVFGGSVSHDSSPPSYQTSSGVASA